MIKTMALLSRKPDVTPEQFDAHWHRPHGDPLSLAIDTLRHYVQSTRKPVEPVAVTYSADEEPTYDGVRELWFSDMDALKRAHAGEPDSWHALFAPAVADTSQSTLFVCTQRRLR